MILENGSYSWNNCCKIILLLLLLLSVISQPWSFKLFVSFVLNTTTKIYFIIDATEWIDGHNFALDEHADLVAIIQATMFIVLAGHETPLTRRQILH